MLEIIVNCFRSIHTDILYDENEIGCNVFATPNSYYPQYLIIMLHHAVFL